MKKLFMIAAVAALGFGMASCAEEGTTPGNNDGKSGLLKIKLLNTASGTTRAATPEDESVVNVLEIWVFEDGGTVRSNSADGFVSYFTVADADFEPDANGDYTATLNVQPGEKDVLVIANANLTNAATANMSLSAIMEAAAAQQFTKANNKEVFADAGFVMAGWNLDVTIDGDTECDVKIDRNVAKIAVPIPTTTGGGVNVDLTLTEWQALYPGETLTAIPTGSGFEFNGFAVLNGLPKSVVGFPWIAFAKLNEESPYNYSPEHAYLSTQQFNYNNPWNWDAGAYTYDGTPNTGAWKTQIPTDSEEAELGARLWSTGDNMMNPVSPVNTANMAAWAPYAAWMGEDYGGATLDPVYVYESKPGVLTNTANGYAGYNHDQVIALIIGGTISATGLQDVERYWRVNVRGGSFGEAFHIIRNSVYTTSINAITSIGHATPWEAENEDEIIDEPGVNPTDFVISINDWETRPTGNGEL